MKDFETTEVPSIEFIGYLYHNTSKITTQCYSQGINQQKGVGKFWYLKYFSCGVHLRNTSRLFLATQTLDADIWTTNQNIQKPDTLLFIDTLRETVCIHFARAAVSDTR